MGVHATSSALAELAACAILTPAETLKQRLQVTVKGQSSSLATNAEATSLHPRSLWKGYWALAGRNLPFTALQFPLYEHFRESLAKRVGLRRRRAAGIARAAHQEEPKHVADVVTGEEARRRATNALRDNRGRDLERGIGERTGARHYATAGVVSGASAAAAGAISALATTPLDLVKTRIMLDASPERGRSTRGTIALMRDILKREGIPGIMRGGTLRCAWTALGAGVYLGSYEAGREWWGDIGKERYEDVKEKAEDVVEDVKARR